VGFTLVVWLACGVLASESLAQPPGAAIRGTIVDESGARVAGARVEAHGPALVGGPRRAFTDWSGRYAIVDLPPGTYEVRAGKPGFTHLARPGILVAAGGGHVVDFSLRVGDLSDTITVPGGLAGVDVTDPAVPQNVGASQVRDLPTRGEVPDLINLVPGIAGNVAFGGTQGSNALSVDGLDLTDTLTQAPHLQLNQHWLEEVHVAALGAGASHGGSTGAFANAIVRSGGNTWSGLAQAWAMPRAWTAENTSGLSESLQRDFAPRNVVEQWSLQGQAGGPLRLDRLWLFAGLERQRLHERPAGYEGTALRREDSTHAIVKTSAAPGDAVRVEAMVLAGTRRIEGDDLGLLVSQEAASDFEQRETAWSTRLAWVPGAAGVFEVRYAGFDSPLRLAPNPTTACDGPPGHFDVVTGVVSVNALECYDGPRARHQMDATTTLAGSIGRLRHEVRAGAAWMAARGRNEWTVPGGMQIIEADGDPFLAVIHAGYSRDARSSNLGWFVEDRIRVSGRLTVVPGLRSDRGTVGTPDDRDALHMWSLSPRVGVAYDIGRDRPTVLRAHWGRYHDPISVNAFRTMQTDYSDYPPVAQAEPGESGEWVVVSEEVPTANVTIDGALEQSRVDQWTLGAERDIGGGVLVQAQYVARRFSDFVGFVDTGSVWIPVERQDPGPDGRTGTADDGGMVSLFRKANPGQERLLYTNPVGARRRYDAVQAVVRRQRAGTWQLQASYTWSRVSGNVGNLVYTNAGFGDLATTFANPNRLINSDGRGPHDPTHEVKVLGTARVGWWGGLRASGVYRYTTGFAWAREASFPGAGLGTSAVRMEPNGARRVAAINELDLRVEKSVPLGGRRELGVLLDAFNWTNHGVPDSDSPFPVWTVSGPNLGVPTAWRPARSLRATVRFTF
jgi:hypothetical protein